MKKIKLPKLPNILSAERKVSPLQMSLTFVLVLCLILSNILVVKPIDLFGVKELANTCSILVFPVTYMLSDVFSEVYGYKWSRTTATWAFLGTILCSLLFALSIALPGNDTWTMQEAFVSILGSTPQIAFASVLAFWTGDLVNDKLFSFLKKKDKGNKKTFGIRAILSSLAGKYIDGAVFTFIGLSFLPLETKLIMVATCPFVQVCIEILVLPLTSLLVKKIKSYEEKNNNDLETL
jgi:uncharacterized integral membrane protein (TIGR00697 family)